MSASLGSVCWILLMLLFEIWSVSSKLPLEWFEKKNPKAIPNIIPKDKLPPALHDFIIAERTIEYTVPATWDEDKQYKTHVTVQRHVNFGDEYFYILAGLYINEDSDIMWSNAKITYDDVKRSKGLLQHVSANPFGSFIDIYYMDENNEKNYNVKKKGTFVVTLFNSIFKELRIDKGELIDDAKARCKDGSQFRLLFHRMWKGEGSWYSKSTFGYNPKKEYVQELKKAKKEIMGTEMSALYQNLKIGNEIHDKVKNDFGGDAVYALRLQTLQELMEFYEKKMVEFDEYCPKYVEMMRLLHTKSESLKPLLDTVANANLWLYHGPYYERKTLVSRFKKGVMKKMHTI